MNINFTNLTKLVKPKGVIHVGANTCQELPLYLEHGIENRLWIEGNEWLANQTREATNENILELLIGNDTPGSSVEITIAKSGSQVLVYFFVIMEALDDP